MSKFFGFVVLCCALAIGFSSITGCPGTKDKDKDKKDKDAKPVADKDKDAKPVADKDAKPVADKDAKPVADKDTTAAKKGTKPEVKVAKLTLTKLEAVTLGQGETKEVKIAITRENLEDAVQVKFDKLPKGVTVVDAKTEIPAKADSATFKLKAADDAAVDAGTDATVSAWSGEIKADTTLKVIVAKKATK